MVNETIVIMVEDKQRTETIRIPCKNSARSGGSKHKTIVLNCITVHMRAQKLVFKQYPLRHRSKDGNKLVKDSDNTIVPITPRAIGNSTLLSSVDDSHDNRI